MTCMTPRERMLCALKGGTPDKVPTAEIDFQLHKDLLGKEILLGSDLKICSPKEKARLLHQNAEIYTETALALDLSAITIHPPEIECSPGYIADWAYPTVEDHLHVIRLVKELSGGVFAVAGGIDGTYQIPAGNSIEEFAYGLADDPDGMKERAEKYLYNALEIMKRVIDAGAEVLYNCSDYCFNQGPFLSPAMFEKFVYPYLKRQTEELRRCGAYVIKHTDGNIMPILEMIADCHPHAIHSLDPLAKVDIKEVKEKYGHRLCLMGNVDVTKLQQGPVEDIIKSAEYALRCGMPGGGYIFSSCNSIFSKVPLENYRVMLAVRDRMGVYPTEIK